MTQGRSRSSAAARSACASAPIVSAVRTASGWSALGSKEVKARQRSVERVDARPGALEAKCRCLRAVEREREVGLSVRRSAPRQRGWPADTVEAVEHPEQLVVAELERRGGQKQHLLEHVAERTLKGLGVLLGLLVGEQPGERVGFLTWCASSSIRSGRCSFSAPRLAVHVPFRAWLSWRRALRIRV